MKLSKADHVVLVLWAAACAERLLPLFERRYRRDRRPRRAVEAARAWARGELAFPGVRKAALAAHAAARVAAAAAKRARREATADAAAAACAAARAAGHAVATAHVPTHAAGVVYYGGKALGAKAPAEHAWQRRHLPKRLRRFASTAR